MPFELQRNGGPNYRQSGTNAPWGLHFTLALFESYPWLPEWIRIAATTGILSSGNCDDTLLSPVRNGA